jgi:hypothetical protein
MMVRMHSWGRRPTMIATAYVLAVATLIGAAFAFQDIRPLGPILYFTGWAMTMPTGVLIYPALWANSVVAGLASADEWSTRIGVLGTLAVFAAAAAINALLARTLITGRNSWTATSRRERGSSAR